MAEASALPARTSAASHGMLGCAAWRASSAQGGDRKAEDVIAQTTMAPMSSPGVRLK